MRGGFQQTLRAYLDHSAAISRRRLLPSGSSGIPRRDAEAKGRGRRDRIRESVSPSGLPEWALLAPVHRSVFAQGAAAAAGRSGTRALRSRQRPNPGKSGPMVRRNPAGLPGQSGRSRRNHAFASFAGAAGAFAAVGGSGQHRRQRRRFRRDRGGGACVRRAPRCCPEGPQEIRAKQGRANQ